MEHNVTKLEANKLAGIIAKAVGAVKGTAVISTWLGVPGISIAIHLDKKPYGRKYAIHNIIGETHCTIRLIEGDGRQSATFRSMDIGQVWFDSHSIVQCITAAAENPLPKKEFNALLERVQSGELKLSDIEVAPPTTMPESEYCAHCRRSVDRDTEALERFNDGTILHVHCAEELRDEGQLPALWYAHSNGLDTFNQVAVTNGEKTIVVANLARFEKCIFRDDLWKAAIAFGDAYAMALNCEIEEN